MTMMTRTGVMMRRAMVTISAAFLLTACMLAAKVDGQYNRVGKEPQEPSADVRSFHDNLFVADLHSDALLWNRDPLVRHERGHVDLPRMLEGNLALQVFTIATRSPWGMNEDRTVYRDDDLIGVLTVMQGQPVRTWGSLAERTLYQAERLHKLEADSEGRFRVLRTADDLRAYMDERRDNRHIAAGILGIEGIHALDGDLANLDRFYEAGIRMIGPSHFFDNEWAGSAHGAEKGGLTIRGRALIQRMEQLGILLDLSHISPQALDEALAISTRPTVVSHTGVRGTCDNNRNLSDDQLRAIAAKGGVIGIAFFPKAVCGDEVADVVRAIRHTVDLVGVEYVALGSDWDGMVTVPIDPTGLPMITEALLEDGFSNEEVALIMGGNVTRLFLTTLP